MKSPILLILTLVGLLSGCVGTYFTFDKARQIKVGMTESEVHQIMGRPNSVTSAGGHIRWMYVYGTALGTSAAVTFIFTDAKVTEVPSIPASFK